MTFGKTMARRMGYGLILALVGASMLTGDITLAGTTSNRVKTIDANALDEMISDRTYRGFVVFMASWCPPCKKEMPVLAELYRRYHLKGVRILAVSVDVDGPGDVQTLVDKMKIPFPVYWVGMDAVMKYQIFGIPMLMVIDKGELIEKLPGGQPRGQLIARLEDLLKRSEPN